MFGQLQDRTREGLWRVEKFRCAAPAQGDHNLKLAYRHGHTVQRVHDDAFEKSPLPGSNRGSLHTDDSDVTVNAFRLKSVCIM